MTNNRLHRVGRFVASSAATLGLIAGSVACGGGSTPPPTPPSSSNVNSGNNNGNNNAGGANALLDQILGGLPSGSSAAATSPKSDSVQPTQPAAAPSHPSGSSGNLDTFDQDVARIKGTVPGWDNGTGIAVKFLKEADGSRLSLIFVDPTPPVFKDGVGLWMIQGKAMASGKTLANYVLLLKTLAPGRYEGSPTKKDVVMSVAMGDHWDAKDPETTWSINDGSWCELVLRQGKGPNDLEGDFRAKLVDNKGTGFHTIETGYVYIKR